MRATTKNNRKRLEAEHSKLSGVLESAVRKMKQAIESGLEVDMTRWIGFRDVEDTEPCTVCMGGGEILAGIGSELPGLDRAPTPRNLHEVGICSEEARNQLYALNQMRMACFTGAYREMFKRRPGQGSPERTILETIEKRVKSSGLSIHKDWTRTGGAEADGEKTLKPGPMLDLFENEVVPALRSADL